MPKAAVLGKPISHSLSPILHNAGYAALGLQDFVYERFEVDAQQLPKFVASASEDYRGFSVTMPGKFAALEFADEVTDRARLIGSANTLVRTDAGWRADNTDTEGVLGALGELLGHSSGTLSRAMVIGSGGTARPALWALAQRGVGDIYVLNRSDRLHELAPLAQTLGVELHRVSFDDDLLVLNRSMDVVVSTVPSAAVSNHLDVLCHAPLLDVIYEPLPTELMIHAAADGYPTVGGNIMLAYQSFSQFEQFTGQPAPRQHMLDALCEVLERKRKEAGWEPGGQPEADAD
ncbi:shikimate dehydrogenase [Corynebacterium lizhenjunii]|uniref:Shikimate dehydrogenase n=1 Tax=Corynebacterium lizhenjunii TaxID=2709394 RepID=A0A7T0KCG3_9CORY|nr:shikimate dehydrogenase [Corynebacterium lizhenjunii]QPK78218.1 shikimate dehydrogenase [Corynebacterium lizhenjunii]